MPSVVQLPCNNSTGEESPPSELQAVLLFTDVLLFGCFLFYI